MEINDDTFEALQFIPTPMEVIADSKKRLIARLNDYQVRLVCQSVRQSLACGRCALCWQRA